MEQIPGKTVVATAQKNRSNRISNHDIAAGHSLTKRRQALEIKIVAVETHKNRIRVKVDLTNTGAGHKMPTGLPVKKITLEVKVEDVNGSRRQIQQRVYQKTVADAQGKILTKVADLMLDKGTAILSDNRIAPLETRRESFTFFVEKPEEQTISAAVYYGYTPEILQPTPIRIKLIEVQRRVR